MKAGRELDILVAEKVMGWCWATLSIDLGREFYPSTNMADAWEVVEKMHKGKFLFDISLSVGAGYTVRFFSRDKEIFHTASYVETAPHAICIAALKTVGYQAKGEIE